MSVIQWVQEPTNRWLPCCNCQRSGRWLLLILGRQTGGPVCQQCRVDMQQAWDDAHEVHGA